MPRSKKINNSEGPTSFKRDEHGLLENVQYTFTEDGSVDWRAMIKEEHLFPNKSWFELRKKDVPRSIEGLKDHQLLIKLSGIKELARLRGFDSVSFETVKCELNHVAVKCTVSFIPNFETGDRVVYEDMANATLDNTSSFAKKFLETIACNRAFVRCIRNFLNVHIVGDDEIDKSDLSAPNNTSSSDLTPTGVLKKIISEKYSISEYPEFKNVLREFHKEGKISSISIDTIKEWNDFNDISAKDARILISVIKSN